MTERPSDLPELESKRLRGHHRGHSNALFESYLTSGIVSVVRGSPHTDQDSTQQLS